LALHSSDFKRRQLKEKNIEHWECKCCTALNPDTEHECWRCQQPIGSEATPENIAIARSQIPRPRIGGCGTAILVVAGAIAALFCAGALFLLNAMSYAK
jgi:hypothetical protein